MKKALRFACLFILIIFTGNSRAASTNSLQLMVELQDGSRVVGKGGDEKFEFRSEILGGIKLPLEQIGSIEFQPKTNAVKLVAANGDRLAVFFVTKEIHIETSFGKVSIPADSIRRLQVSASGISGRPKAGLVALWSGEGNANDSVGNCNGQLVNGVGFEPGKVGQAFDLNEDLNNYPGIRVGTFGGGSGYDGRLNRGGGFVLIPASQSLDVGKGDGFTFECWIKPVTLTSANEIFEYERTLATSDGADVGMLFAIHNTLPDGNAGSCLFANILDSNQGTHIIATPANLLVAGVWQNVALTYDKSSGIASIYINGTVVKQANIGSFTTQTSFGNLLLGARTTFSSIATPNSVYSGGMDEFGIYNRALSAAEIQAICTEENGGQPLPPSASGSGFSIDDSGFRNGPRLP